VDDNGEPIDSLDSAPPYISVKGSNISPNILKEGSDQLVVRLLDPHDFQGQDKKAIINGTYIPGNTTGRSAVFRPDDGFKYIRYQDLLSDPIVISATDMAEPDCVVRKYRPKAGGIPSGLDTATQLQLSSGANVVEKPCRPLLARSSI